MLLQIVEQAHSGETQSDTRFRVSELWKGLYFQGFVVAEFSAYAELLSLVVLLLFATNAGSNAHLLNLLMFNYDCAPV